MAGGVAEHDAVSAAITHRDTTAMPLFARLSGRSRMAQACHGVTAALSQYGPGQPRLRPPMPSDASLAGDVPRSACLT